MLNETDLIIIPGADGYKVTVSGRANFEYAVPLRELANSEAPLTALQIDLAQCTAMDSTFMGVLTMLALKLRRSQRQVEIFNASTILQKLLAELGIAKLFVFKTGSINAGAGAVGLGKSAMLTQAETIVEAHEALTQADRTNAERFAQVIELSRQETEKLRQQSAAEKQSK